MAEQNYTYLLRCADGTLYCGWTNDLEKRAAAHNAGTGAKYTKPRRPVELAYYETFATKQEAMRREAEIKRQLYHHASLIRKSDRWTILTPFSFPVAMRSSVTTYLG